MSNIFDLDPRMSRQLPQYSYAKTDYYDTLVHAYNNSISIITFDRLFADDE